MFRITPSGALTILHTFDDADGYSADSGLVQGSDGSFYGTTRNGGSPGGSGFGTVYRITPAGVLTTLHAFGDSDGPTPNTTLVQGSDGNFYGTTVYGGINGDGSVCRISPDGMLTTLYSFGGSDGKNPRGGWCKAGTAAFTG